MPKFKNSQKTLARYIYFYTDSTQKDIADAAGVTEKTIRAWIRNGSWAEQKKAAFYSPDQQVQNLYEELRQIDDNIKKRGDGERFGTKEETEARAKLLALIVAHAKNPVDNWRNVNRRLALGKLTKEVPEFEGYDIVFCDDNGNCESIPPGSGRGNYDIPTREATR
jgi:hypothetical protein